MLRLKASSLTCCFLSCQQKIFSKSSCFSPPPPPPHPHPGIPGQPSFFSVAPHTFQSTVWSTYLFCLLFAASPSKSSFLNLKAMGILERIILRRREPSCTLTGAVTRRHSSRGRQMSAGGERRRLACSGELWHCNLRSTLGSLAVLAPVPGSQWGSLNSSWMNERVGGAGLSR